MKVAIWDIHALKKDGDTIHFEIIVPADVKNITRYINTIGNFLKLKN